MFFNDDELTDLDATLAYHEEHHGISLNLQTIKNLRELIREHRNLKKHSYPSKRNYDWSSGE